MYDVRKKKNMERGFVALMSVIIISVILLLIANSLSLSGFYGRFNILGSEMKERSSSLAEACVDTAILKLANDASYSPTNEAVIVGTDTCLIKSVTGGNIKTIQAQANYKDFYTNLEVEIDATDFSIDSWEELGTF